MSSRYLITHNDCMCLLPHDVCCATPHEVALFFWGREVWWYTVYDGECPYRFYASSVSLIEALLTNCNPRMMRHVLPCSLWTRGKVLVCIGDPSAGRPVREISYAQWLTEGYASAFDRLRTRQAAPDA